MIKVWDMTRKTLVDQVDWQKELLQSRRDFTQALSQQLSSLPESDTPAASEVKSTPLDSAVDTTAASSARSGNVAGNNVVSAASNVVKLAQPTPMTPVDYGAMLIAQRQAAHPADPAAIPASSADQLYARTLAPYGARAWATAQGIGGAPETWTAAQAKDILGSSAPSLSSDPAKAVSLINARRASAGLTLVTVAKLTPLGTVV